MSLLSLHDATKQFFPARSEFKFCFCAEAGRVVTYRLYINNLTKEFTENEKTKLEEREGTTPN